MNFLGEANHDGTILDKDDNIVGYVDLGRATFRDQTDSHYGTITREGRILNRNETEVAKVENFSFFDLKKVALYLFLIHKGLLEDENSISNHVLDLPSFDSEDSIPTVRTESNFEVGEFKCGLDGYYLNIINLGCPSLCIYLTLTKSGHELRFSRKIRVDGIVKERVVDISLPQPVGVEDIDALYDEHKTTLTIHVNANPFGCEKNDTKINIQTC